MRITLMLALAGTVLLSGCSYGDAENSPAPIRDREAKILANELKGKVAGEPQNCISTLGRENMIRISDDMLLYRQSGRLVYQNKLRSPCPGLAPCDSLISIIRTLARFALVRKRSALNVPSSLRQPK